MKRILGVGINARFTHTCLSIRCLRAAALSVTSEDLFDIVEFQIHEPLQRIVYEIVSRKPDVILLSVYIWNVSIISMIVSDIHALLPNTAILLGGPEVYGKKQEWTRNFPFIAACIEGYGETVVKHWARTEWNDFSDACEKFSSKDFLEAGSMYLPDEKDALINRYLYYESSRGCPYRCSYCLSSNSMQHYFEKPLEVVKHEIAELMVFEPALIKFVDRSFNADPVRARSLWTHLAQTYRSSQTRFHFEVMPDRLSETDIELLSSLPQHLFQFEVGIQTIHERTRSIIHRIGSWSEERALLSSLLLKTKIPVHVDMIVGLPGETDDDIAKTFNALMDLQAEHLQIGFLKILPGTEMHERASDFGITAMTAPPYEVYKTYSLDLEAKMRWKDICLLVESIANNGVSPDLMLRARHYFGSWQKAYSNLLAHCIDENFDIRTKNRERLVPLIHEWVNLFSGTC